MKAKRILLVEPKRSRKYHTAYPPLGLLKFATYHKQQGDIVHFVRGLSDNEYIPDTIYITSLFTYAYEPVHDAISYYLKKYKTARIIVGGIYATLCSDHIIGKYGKNVEIVKGIVDKVENLLPDYSMVPDWDASILFASRGCIRKCEFCSVPILEQKYTSKRSIKHLIYPGHSRVILWDNNILASPSLSRIMDELKELELEVDFNQGLDARLMTNEIVIELKQLKIKFIRLAYDKKGIREDLKRCIDLLKNIGFSGKRIIVYCLHNFSDSPDDFLDRIRDLLEWNVVAYPMRYEPLEPRLKNTFVSSNWTAEELDMVAKARRVIGFGGAFPPYEALKKKVLKAKNFHQAFKLRPIQK